MNDASQKPLPPGRTGWPVLGETLPFLQDEFRFVKGRLDEYGPVSRAFILGRDTAILSGAAATEAFNDESRVIRAGGMPGFVEQFFGGKSLPLLDGATHRARKKQVMGAFSRSAMSGYVTQMQSRVEHHLDAWSAESEVTASKDFKRLALDVIGHTMLSMEPGADLDAVIENFHVLAAGFAGLPIPLPGTTFTKALAARDRIFAVVRRYIASHRAKRFEDGLSRMLAVKAEDGAGITDEGALLELHHFNIAGYLVFTHFATMVHQLAQREDVRAKLEAEVRAKAGEGTLSLEQLAGMPYLEQFVKEVKRFTPLVPVFFGQAAVDFEFEGYRIPKGWMVLWGHHATHYDSKLYRDPERFDPERFNAERAEDAPPFAYAPQGAGPIAGGHKCAGFDFATVFMQVFAVVLLRRMKWELPEQDLSLRWKMVPPEYVDGLRVRFTRV